MTPTPVIALNRAIAVAETGKIGDALAIVDELDLSTYYLFHATRGELLSRLARHAEAAAAYEAALALTENQAERRLLESRRAAARAAAGPPS
jgi:RNA polymerase sigma-70 factor (ECF subfamily)